MTIKFIAIFLLNCLIFPNILHAMTITHEDVNDPKYRWMDQVIQNELKPFEKKGIPITCLKRFDLRTKEHIKHFQIKNGVVLGKGCLLKMLTRLAQDLKLPDLELLYFEGDGIVHRRDFPWRRIPILAGSKPRGLDHVLLFCDPTIDKEDKQYYDWPYIQSQIEKYSKASPWKSKISKLIWRGANTGIMEYYTEKNWKSLIRGKLVALGQEHSDLMDVSFSHLLPWKTENIDHMKKILPIAERLDHEDQMEYKYQIAIDGDTFSWIGDRWRLLTNCVTFIPDSKQIIWYTEALIPWKHYIPVKSDYSDLIEKLTWAKSHDLECQKIAEESTQLVQENLTRKHEYIYAYKFLIEYAKLCDKYLLQ